MANVFVNIPVPAANGAGAATDVAALGRTKSFVIGGGFHATVNVEYATDTTGVNWAPLATFQGAGNLTVDVACNWIRAVTSNYVSGTPNLDVGADDGGAISAVLTADGASVDISGLSTFKTVVVPPGFVGRVEASEDGTSWAQIFSFAVLQPNGQSREFAAQYARVIGGVDGTPVDVDIASASNGGGGSSSDPYPTRPPAEVFDYFNDFIEGAGVKITEDSGNPSTGFSNTTGPEIRIVRIGIGNPGEGAYCEVGSAGLFGNFLPIGGAGMAAGQQLIIEWGGGLDTEPVAEADFCARFLASNLMASSSGAGGNGTGFGFSCGLAQNGNINWWGFLNDAQKVDLGVSPVDLDYNSAVFRVVYTKGTGVEWFINGTLVGSIAGAPPAEGSAVNLGCNCRSDSGGDGAQPTLVWDYVWVHYEYTRYSY